MKKNILIILIISIFAISIFCFFFYFNNKEKDIKPDMPINTTTNIKDEIPVEKISVNTPTNTFTYGESFSLVAKTLPENATNKNLIWKSSNPDIVSVDNYGNIKIIENEDAKVIITIETEDGNCQTNTIINTKKINQLIKVNGLIIDNKEVTLKYGETIKINAKILPENATNKNIIWTSSNPSLVSVDSNGNITVINNQDSTVTISAETEEGHYKANVKVNTKKIEDLIKVTGISFKNKEIKLEKGATLQLVPIITPSNATVTNLTWESTNSNIASVNNKGLINAKSVGKTKITAKIGQITSVVTINVTDTTKPSSSPTLVIKTKTDNYTIAGSSTGHVSKKYYSNDKSISIKIKQTEDIEYYAYAVATTQEKAQAATKTIANVNTPIVLELNESQTKTLYIWGVDGSNNYSKRYIRLYIKHQKIFLEESDFTCLPTEALNGDTCYSTLKRTGSTYENYTSEQKELITRYFNSKISKNSSDKRKATIAAVQFLAGEFDTKINYKTNLTKYSNSFYLNKGLNIYSDKTCWNCTNNSIEYALQCSGFVSWALVNGGVSEVANYGVKPIANILLAYESPGNYYANTENNLIVSNSSIIEVSKNTPWNKVQAGDLVGYKGHVGIIIHIDTEYVYIAHNADWSAYEPYNVSGIQITRYSKVDYHNNKKFGAGRIILMDEVYKR